MGRLTVLKLSDEFGLYSLHVRCVHCLHNSLVPPGRLAKRFGWDFRIDKLRDHLVCTKCGKRGARIEPVEKLTSRRQ